MEENSTNSQPDQLEQILTDSKARLTAINEISELANKKQSEIIASSEVISTKTNEIAELANKKQTEIIANAEVISTTTSEISELANKKQSEIIASSEVLSTKTNEISELVNKKESEIIANAEAISTKAKEITSLQTTSQDAKQKIDQILTESQEKLSAISTASDSVKQKEIEINTYNTRIIELKANAEANTNSVNDTLTQAKELKGKVDILFKETFDLNKEIKSFHEESSAKYTDINTFYPHYEELKEKINDSEEGIAVTLDNAKKIFNQISQTNKEATTQKEEIIANRIKSNDLLGESSKIKNNINDNYSESNKLKNEIGQILDLVRDTGLSNSFDRRRKRSQKSIYIALVVIGVGVALSVCLIIAVFLGKKGQLLFNNITNDYIKFLLRITLTAPGVFLAWFGTVQFSKERYYLEQYEFKTAAALALENYTKLLKQNYMDKNNEIFSLNIELIKSVYKEPAYFRPKNPIWGFRYKTPKIGSEITAVMKHTPETKN